jgi:transcriptional regulator with XRE-family HTH domain
MTHRSNNTAAPTRQPANVPLDGAKIRRLRQQLGETITSLAPQVPMSFGYLADIERGRRRRVKPPMAVKLAAALGKELDEIRAA